MEWLMNIAAVGGDSGILLILGGVGYHKLTLGHQRVSSRLSAIHARMGVIERKLSGKHEGKQENGK